MQLIAFNVSTDVEQIKVCNTVWFRMGEIWQGPPEIFYVKSEWDGIHRKLSTQHLSHGKNQASSSYFIIGTYGHHPASSQKWAIMFCFLFWYLKLNLPNGSTRLLSVFVKDWVISKMTVSIQMIHNDLQFYLKCLMSVTLDKGLLVGSGLPTSVSSWRQNKGPDYA